MSPQSTCIWKSNWAVPWENQHCGLCVKYRLGQPQHVALANQDKHFFATSGFSVSGLYTSISLAQISQRRLRWVYTLCRVHNVCFLVERFNYWCYWKTSLAKLLSLRSLLMWCQNENVTNSIKYVEVLSFFYCNVTQFGSVLNTLFEPCSRQLWKHLG